MESSCFWVANTQATLLQRITQTVQSSFKWIVFISYLNLSNTVWAQRRLINKLSRNTFGTGPSDSVKMGAGPRYDNIFGAVHKIMTHTVQTVVSYTLIKFVLEYQLKFKLNVAYRTFDNQRKGSKIYRNTFYIFILRRRRLCKVGINSKRVRTYLSSVAGTLFCEVMQRTENTHRGADRSAWVTTGSLSSLERPADLFRSLERLTDISSGSLPSVQNYSPYVVFSSPMQKYEYASSSTHILFMAGYWNLHTSGFFSGNLLILSANGNICHSIHRQ